MDATSIAMIAVCFFLGLLLDFLFNGVFKIIWMVIYVPAYVVAAIVLGTELSKTRFKPYVRDATIALLAGTLLAHLFWMDSSDQRTYDMSIGATTDPMMLESSAWPQRLILSGEALKKVLASWPAGKPVPVLTERLTNYGCTLRFDVNSVAGVDVRQDPDANWVWKTEPHVTSTTGPGNEDQDLFWCKIQFYRTNTRR